MTTPADMIFYRARVAERLERTDDIIEIMNQLIKQKPCLNSKERELFFTGYKDSINSVRGAIRLLEVYTNDDANGGDSSRKECVQSFIRKYIDELNQLCIQAIKTIDDTLINEANENEACVFYQKMRADYLRYMAEFKSGSDKEDCIKKSELSYQAALQIATRHLRKSDPLYLGLALNYAVCECEFMSKKKEAVVFAEHVFKEAVKTLNELDEQNYGEATSILQLIRDDITQWTNA